MEMVHAKYEPGMLCQTGVIALPLLALRHLHLPPFDEKCVAFEKKTRISFTYTFLIRQKSGFNFKCRQSIPQIESSDGQTVFFILSGIYEGD